MMPGELATKLRLVRCPKCRLLLPELPHYNVYKCGGCGTTLQAKRRKSEAVNSESSSHESGNATGNISDLVSEDTFSKKGQLAFRQGNVEITTATTAFSGEFSSDDNSKKGQNQNGPTENDLGTKATTSSSGECSLVENAGRGQREHGECNGEQLVISNLSVEDLENKMDTREHSGIKIDQHEVSNKCCSTELIQREIEANDANLQFVGSEESNHESLLLKGEEEELCSAWDEENAKNDKSAPGGAKSMVNITESDFASKFSTANLASEKASISHITPHISKGHATSDNHVLSYTEQLKQAQNSINLRFEHVRSMDKSDVTATEVINPNSEFSDTLEELYNSPTTRSSHAYDGSVSSYEGIDEQIPYCQHLNPLDTKSVDDDDDFHERSRMAKGVVDSMIYRGRKAQQHLNFSSDFLCEDHNVMKVSERIEFPSKMPFHYDGSRSGHESGGPTNQLLDELYRSSIFLPSGSCEDPDQEKMKLLRMIYILQDQLNSTSSLSAEINGRPPMNTYKGKHTLSYNSHDLQEERFHHALDYPKCNGRCSDGINWRQRHKLSLRPCSGEATSSTHHVDLSCFHWFPREWQCPAELPPHVCQHEGLCRYHHGHNCCSSHYSCPLNPQGTMNSKTPSYSCETNSDDQRHQAYEVKKYPREKRNLANRHVRPVAGGAPFVTCHHCFRLLQLPADFLLFKRVYHKLKCGSCSEVLKFSLTNGSHMVSYTPSELNDQSKVVNGSNRPSESDTNHYNPSQADPVSDSDNFGLSASKSYFSRGMSGAVTEKEKISSTQSSSTEITAGTNVSAGLVSYVFVSGKVSSQMDARPPPPPRSSPLHQLMGYTSLSQVIRGIRSSGECNNMINEEKHAGNRK